MINVYIYIYIDVVPKATFCNRVCMCPDFWNHGDYSRMVQNLSQSSSNWLMKNADQGYAVRPVVATVPDIGREMAWFFESWSWRYNVTPVICLLWLYYNFNPTTIYYTTCGTCGTFLNITRCNKYWLYIIIWYNCNYNVHVPIARIQKWNVALLTAGCTRWHVGCNRLYESGQCPWPDVQSLSTPNLRRQGRWWPMWWMRTWFCNAWVLLWIDGRKDLAKSSSQGKWLFGISLGIWIPHLKQSIWGIECFQPSFLFLITEMLDSSGDAFVTYTVVSRLDCIPCRAKIDKFGIKRPLFSRFILQLWMNDTLYPTTWSLVGIKKDSENL